VAARAAQDAVAEAAAATDRAVAAIPYFYHRRGRRDQSRDRRDQEATPMIFFQSLVSNPVGRRLQKGRTRLHGLMVSAA